MGILHQKNQIHLRSQAKQPFDLLKIHSFTKTDGEMSKTNKAHELN